MATAVQEVLHYLHHLVTTKVTKAIIINNIFNREDPVIEMQMKVIAILSL